MIGFPLVLVDILRNSNHEISLRQAATIYLKNLVNRAWNAEDSDNKKVTQISEQDKVVLRSQIADLIVEAPGPIRLVFYYTRL
jgi:hypothetical protein